MMPSALRSGAEVPGTLMLTKYLTMPKEDERREASPKTCYGLIPRQQHADHRAFYLNRRVYHTSPSRLRDANVHPEFPSDVLKIKQFRGTGIFEDGRNASKVVLSGDRQENLDQIGPGRRDLLHRVSRNGLIHFDCTVLIT